MDLWVSSPSADWDMIEYVITKTAISHQEIISDPCFSSGCNFLWFPETSPCIDCCFSLLSTPPYLQTNLIVFPQFALHILEPVSTMQIYSFLIELWNGILQECPYHHKSRFRKKAYILYNRNVANTSWCIFAKCTRNIINIYCLPSNKLFK